MPRSLPTVLPSPKSESPDIRPISERLLAVIELVKTQGLQELSQAWVAAAAGVRQSHLTYSFLTHKDLSKALVQTIYTRLAFDQLIQGASPPASNVICSSRSSKVTP